MAPSADAAFLDAANRAYAALQHAPPSIVYRATSRMTSSAVGANARTEDVTYHPATGIAEITTLAGPSDDATDEPPLVAPTFDALGTFEFHGGATAGGFHYSAYNVAPLRFVKPDSRADVVVFSPLHYTIHYDPSDTTNATLVLEPTQTYLRTNPAWYLTNVVLDPATHLPLHVTLAAGPHAGSLTIDYAPTPFGLLVSHAAWEESRPLLYGGLRIGRSMVRIEATFEGYRTPAAANRPNQSSALGSSMASRLATRSGAAPARMRRTGISIFFPVNV